MPLKRPLLVIATVVFSVGGLLWLFWPNPLPRPREELRVFHPRGYSIIRPPEFSVDLRESGIGDKADGIYLAHSRHRNPPPRLSVERFAGEPDFQKLADRGFTQTGTFQGREARVMIGPSGRPPVQVWNHRIVVQIDGDWFEIAVTDPRYFELDRSGWRAYVESFRYEPRATTAPGGR